jgi:uncharacterized protein (TIGR03435 family)
VIDKDAAWDFTLSFMPTWMLRGPAGEVGTASDPAGGLSFFEAFGKQLGLKLEMRKRMQQVLVIDGMDEKPVDN